MNDRRKDQRYQLGNSCILNHENKVGTVIDICKGGMSCMCLDSNTCENMAPQHVDIFCIKDNLLAQGLKVKKLGTEVILGKYIQNIKVRKCRIQFEQLVNEQIAQLETIILTYAIQ